MTLREIKQSVGDLSVDQLERLDRWLREQIVKARAKVRLKKTTKREVVEERAGDNNTYRLEKVRCGKKGCKCADGNLHGPYWYAYWSEDGKTKSKYIGKKLGKRIKKAKSELSER